MGIRALACALLRSSMPVAVDAPLEASARLRTEAAAAAAAAAAPLQCNPAQHGLQPLKIPERKYNLREAQDILRLEGQADLVH